MPHYMLSYLGGNHPSTPEEGKQHFAKYQQWLSSLGDAAVSPANPLKGTTTVNANGSVTAGGTTTMSRSEERRVGKEWRSRWSPEQSPKRGEQRVRTV